MRRPRAPQIYDEVSAISEKVWKRLTLRAKRKEIVWRSAISTTEDAMATDLEISRVMELEHGLWLAGFDGSDVPRLVFYDPKTQLPTPFDRNLEEVVGVQSHSQRTKWHALIVGWLGSRPENHPADLRVKIAEKAVAILSPA